MIAGAYDVVVAAGVEVMSRVPMGASIADGKYGFPFGPKIGARYERVGGLVPQGISAEMIAEKWGISREDLDAFGCAVAAARRPGHATRAASRARSCRCSTPTATLMTTDEGIRETHAREARHAEAVVQGGRRGHRRQLVADHRRRRRPLLIMSEEKAAELGLTPRARFVARSPWPATTPGSC